MYLYWGQIGTMMIKKIHPNLERDVLNKNVIYVSNYCKLCSTKFKKMYW